MTRSKNLVKCVLNIKCVFLSAITLSTAFPAAAELRSPNNSSAISRPATAPGLVVSTKETVAQLADFNHTVGITYWPDAPTGTFYLGPVNQSPAPEKWSTKGTQVWLTSVYNSVYCCVEVIKSVGTFDHPLKQLQWVKRENELFSDVRNNTGSFCGIGVNFCGLWIVNLYQATNGLLAVVHLESHTDHWNTFLGLAWSTDGGNSFKYLGPIIIPWLPAPSTTSIADGVNIQGAPMIIVDGYFYLYYKDTGNAGISVARAPMAAVLDAAQQLRTTPWMKYTGTNEGFSGAGMGGQAASLSIEGVVHTDAACKRIDGKCYLLLSTLSWGGQDAWVKIYESWNGIDWVLARTVVEEKATKSNISGYQYCTLIDESGIHNALIGDNFYVYCQQFDDNRPQKMVRWAISVGTSK